MREKSSQTWKDSFTPRSCPCAERCLVIGIAEGSPVLDEVNEADVGKALCQRLWDGAELLEVNMEISLKYSSKAGENHNPSSRGSHQVSVQVMP